MSEETATPRTAADQPVGELVKQLSEQTSALARKEVELAKAELSEKGRAAGIGAGMFGGAGLFGLFALAALTAAFILALAIVLDAWLAALIVAAAYGAVAGVLALVGKQRVDEATPPAPEQAIESVKEDVQWTKQRAKAARQ
jgi:Putative Actinobacterial Holin-X, holin superfamily III